MKNIQEIKEAQETIKMQLTQVETEIGRVNLQGQFAALDWVVALEVEKKDGFKND